MLLDCVHHGHDAIAFEQFFQCMFHIHKPVGKAVLYNPANSGGPEQRTGRGLTVKSVVLDEAVQSSGCRLRSS